MVFKQKFQILTVNDVANSTNIELTKDEKEVLKNDGDTNKFFEVCKTLEHLGVYYCTKHNIFHECYVETDDGDIYSSMCRPVCPLCLFNIDIEG